MADVTVGERTITVERFSLEKVLMIGGVVDAILGKIPDLTAEIEAFEREYRDQNSIKISRAAAELRHIRQQEAANQALLEAGEEPREIKPLSAYITEKAWEEAGGVIEIPASPGVGAMLGKFFPRAYALARDEVLRLLALLAISSDELAGASADGGDLPGKLTSIEGELRAAPADQVLDLLGAAADVIEEQFSGKKGALDKMRHLGRNLFPSPSSQNGAASKPQEEGVGESGESTEATGSPTPEPPSSTDSPSSTDGSEIESSTGSPSASLSG